jgi:two-component system sensor histidine kinase/response regulator
MIFPIMASHLTLPRDEFDRLAEVASEHQQNSHHHLPRLVTVLSQDGTRQLPTTTAHRSENGNRLLVVDDRKLQFRRVGAILGKFGFEIVPASNAAMALERMATCRPDLVLIALLRADVEGLELCRGIRENSVWDGIPVMICSGAGDQGLTARAFENGAADYVANSFSQGELLSRIRAQLCRKTIRDRLKQLEEDKEESLGMLMHNLKNHLGAMNMCADLLRDGKGLPDAACQKLMLENIAISSGQMLSFVNRFLANAATGHHLAIRLEPVCFSEAAACSIRQFQEAARRKDLVVKASLPGDGTLVQADPHALNQVLDNLLSNAVKFSPKGKQISVAVRPSASYVECQVQDQGSGFTPDDKRRMFRRYGRLSARATGGEPSAGLGLSIVKKLMEAMRGELTCESIIGNGATFSIRLPRAAAGG